MLKYGSRFMVVEGRMAGKMGTVYEIDLGMCPEITAIMDDDKRRDYDQQFSYVRYKDVIEV